MTVTVFDSNLSGLRGGESKIWFWHHSTQLPQSSSIHECKCPSDSFGLWDCHRNPMSSCQIAGNILLWSVRQIHFKGQQYTKTIWICEQELVLSRWFWNIFYFHPYLEKPPTSYNLVFFHEKLPPFPRPDPRLLVKDRVRFVSAAFQMGLILKMFWLRRKRTRREASLISYQVIFFVPKSPWSQNCGSPRRAFQKQGFFPPVSPSRDRFKTLMVPFGERKRWTRHKSRFDVGGIRPLNFWVQSFMNVRSQWL